jgi:hypothetical protein
MEPLQFGDEASAVTKIGAAAEQHGLVLFLGAGINGNLYPRWEGLVDRLLDEALQIYPEREAYLKWVTTPPSNFDVYARATLAKILLGPSYTEIIRREIYRSESNGARDKYSNVDKVAKLCCLPEVIAVVTYNYDTHLEMAFGRLSPKENGHRQMIPIGLSGREPDPLDGQNNLLVYHVHGLLRSAEDLQFHRDDPVVLTYDEFTGSIRDMSNWASATQIHFLRSRTCVFLGMSITDWNVLRLLQSVHAADAPSRHWLLTCNNEFASPEDKNVSAQFHFHAKSTLLSTVGVQLSRIGRTFSDMYDVLLQELPLRIWESKNVRLLNADKHT